MKNLAIAGFAALMLCVPVRALKAQENPSNWNLQLNAAPQYSRLLGVNEPLPVSEFQSVDYAIGLTGRMQATPNLGVRSGVAIRRTTFLYGGEVTLNNVLGQPVSGRFETRRRMVGLDVPLLFDVRIAGGESAQLRWLIGAALHIDFEFRNDYVLLPVERSPKPITHQPVSLSLMTGFEVSVPIADRYRLLFAPQLGVGMPNNSAYAFADFSPSVSLMTAGLRVSFEFEALEPRAYDDERQRKNNVMVGYGGRAYQQGGALIYERRLVDLDVLRLYSSTSIGAGPYGLFGATGAVASVGRLRHAADFGLLAGYIEDVDRGQLLPEVGYRYTTASGLVGRFYMTYWPAMKEVNPAAFGVSFGKAF